MYKPYNAGIRSPWPSQRIMGIL